MPRFIAPLVTLFACAALLNAAAPARSQDGPFDAYLQTLADRARAEGVSEAIVRQYTAGLTPNMRVIELDRGQPGSPTRSGFPPLAPYIATHVDTARINGGRRALASEASTLARIEREYGVPAEILVAIFGHETNYGSYTGNFDLARSLATLAWEGRRRDLFADEFVALLKIADRGVPRSRLEGSYAGAFGYPQFLPSVYLRLARDGDGDGRADIWSSRADALASIANYFRDAGWRPGQPWGVRAYVPVDMYRADLATPLASPVCARVHDRHSKWMTVREWRNRGVEPRGVIGEDVLASLFEPDGPTAPGYLITSNYRAILEYNCSNYYAMSVGLLADAIR